MALMCNCVYTCVQLITPAHEFLICLMECTKRPLHTQYRRMISKRWRDVIVACGMMDKLHVDIMGNYAAWRARKIIYGRTDGRAIAIGGLRVAFIGGQVFTWDAICQGRMTKDVSHTYKHELAQIRAARYEMSFSPLALGLSNQSADGGWGFYFYLCARRLFE